MKKIQKNLKFYYIFASSFMLLAVFAVISGIFIISQLQKITEVNEEITEALLVSQLALDFNVENFHTQLEMREYAFDPNETRLLAFRNHQVTLNDLLNNLILSSRESSAMFDGGASLIEEIRVNVGQINADWERMLSIIAAGEEEAIYKVVIANEELFDRLEINKNIDIFVEK